MMTSRRYCADMYKVLERIDGIMCSRDGRIRERLTGFLFGEEKRQDDGMGLDEQDDVLMGLQDKIRMNGMVGWEKKRTG